MSAATLAAALGLAAVPPLGASISQAFDALGPEAVFGAGCIERSSTKTIQAPARWAGSVPARWRGRTVVVMAEIERSRVTALHLALPAISVADEKACRAALASMSDGEPLSAEWRGPDRLIQTASSSIDGQPARLRAIYRASRGECRTMLTIGV